MLEGRSPHVTHAELAAALRSELGSRASVCDALDAVPTGAVPVLVAPAAPAQAPLERCLVIGATRPGAPGWDDVVACAPRAAAWFEVERTTVRALDGLGVHVEHLPVGTSDAWRAPAQAPRDVDVLVLAAFSHRRSVALSRLARQLARRRCRLLLTDPLAPGPAGAEKQALLARSRVLVHVHGHESWWPFPWLDAAQAAVNGCALVCEHAVDAAPLRAGEHFVSGRAETLALLAEDLLSDEERRAAMATGAFAVLEREAPLRAAAQVLLDAAGRVEGSGPVRGPSLGGPAREADAQAADPPDPRRWSTDPEGALLRRGLLAVRLDIAELRRELACLRYEALTGDSVPDTVTAAVTAAHAAATPRISVVVPAYAHASHLGVALDSAAAAMEGLDAEIVVVDDGSNDDTPQVLEAWAGANSAVPMIALRHPVNRGLGHARNTGLLHARGELALALDADNELYPHALERLAEALDADPGAAFAYGILEAFSPTGSHGLRSVFGWNPRRLRVDNPIDALAMVRREGVLESGGYTTVRALAGWEDQDLWCRIAEAGGHGAFVAEIVARYRVVAGSMGATTDISHTAATAALIERYPVLMAGLDPVP